MVHFYRRWNSRQLAHAVSIVAAAKRRRLPEDQGERVADIALETAITESRLLMYANRWNAESLRLPHDAVGQDHGSVGLFQQQVSGGIHSTAGWGTTRQLMDPTVSADKFIDALLRLDWMPMWNWAAAQAVQNSAYQDGSNYRRNDASAIHLRMRLYADA